MRQTAIVISILIFIFSCNNKETVKPKTVLSNVMEITDSNFTPTVDLAKYKLVTDAAHDRKADAAEILKLKRKWPLAMQSKKAADFDSILSQNFTYKDHEFFFNRKEYIESRIKQDEWIITHVKYENVSLQFAGNIGILTYKNRVTNRSLKTGETEYEKITWMDLYEKENGRWKIAAAHAIDYQLELPNDQRLESRKSY